MAFKHENFHTYHEAIAFSTWVHDVLRPVVGKRDSFLADQIGRASTSIGLNLAEGSSRRHERERRQFFSIAMGSAAECAAALDMIAARHLYDAPDLVEGRDQIQRIGSWIRNLLAHFKKEK